MASIIAVAGGTGDLGRTIIGAILADGKFSVVILSRKPELNLIAAANRAAATKRYVPSIWSAKFKREYAEEMPFIKPKILIIDALEKTNLEFSA
ncbi:hypothetical protein CNYM01_05811 [Colletotrichum nymphaeae SA-01]|uniref:NmrA-like domain-containing protein n=1 Tax=Colletotrichum nymphaeae SA-01 TaxID=1460502 RepID=A0A135UWY5_9PEZI|nr:hypothetical protein CNYM01_05811 [Colletotrichum nymphaeae SA-01]